MIAGPDPADPLSRVPLRATSPWPQQLLVVVPGGRRSEPVRRAVRGSGRRRLRAHRPDGRGAGRVRRGAGSARGGGGGDRRTSTSRRCSRPGSSSMAGRSSPSATRRSGRSSNRTPTRSIRPCGGSSRPRPGRPRPNSSPTGAARRLRARDPAALHRPRRDPPSHHDRQPRIADVEADPIGANARLGAYTNCANLLDLCAVAVPAGEADGGQFGVTILSPAFHDAVAADIASARSESAAQPSSFCHPQGYKGKRVGR